MSRLSLLKNHKEPKSGNIFNKDNFLESDVKEDNKIVLTYPK